MIAADRISFDPPLPEWKREAFQRISMGNYNHIGYIGLLFSTNDLGLGADRYASSRPHSSEAVGFLTNISGTALTFAYVGGDFALELERLEDEDVIELALEQLVQMLGSSIRNKFVKGACTRWSADPWTLGAFASAQPGFAHMRAKLRHPIDDRLFFAGEACHLSLWATCAGARQSGISTARRVARTLSSKPAA